MKTNDNIFEGDVVPPSQEEVVVVQETQPQPQMEEGGGIDSVNSASIDGEPPIQEMEEGGVVDDGLVKVDWGLIFTFFK
tara:strand:- start:6799 stop:7035 length:237 start_codon:yes stop_codon:yes gene_type:complete